MMHQRPYSSTCGNTSGAMDTYRLLREAETEDSFLMYPGMSDILEGYMK
jgi:hypothetical protein